MHIKPHPDLASRVVAEYEVRLAELEELKDRSLRQQAEFENFRRRSLKEREETHRFGHQNLVKDLLPTVDNLERALEHAEGSEDGNLEGLLQGNPPRQGDGYAADVVRRIHEDPHCAVHPCQLVVLRNDHRVAWHVRDFSYRFSQLVLESRKLESWPDFPLKITTPRIHAGLNRWITRSDYVLYRDPPGGARGVVRYVLSKRTHREAASYDLEDGARAVLMRRE